MSETPHAAPIVRAVDIEKVYQDNSVPVYALRGVSIDVQRGEFLVIAGPSGSGKTTLLNILGALDVPTQGAVYFEGEEIGTKPRSEVASIRLHKIGFVFQAYNLIPVLTAMENIEFTMMLCRVPERERRERAMALLGELGIAELADKRPHDMSGGQQQRVAVARAMINNPSIIFADEPTANLDSETAGVLLDLMLKVNRERELTFVFSSHDSKVIDRARRLLILKDGRISDER
jgi:putative ABC transport system ATP-binding protein